MCSSLQLMFLKACENENMDAELVCLVKKKGAECLSFFLYWFEDSEVLVHTFHKVKTDSCID